MCVVSLNTPKVLGRGCGVQLLLLRGWGRAGRQAALAGKAGCAYGLRWRITLLKAHLANIRSMSGLPKLDPFSLYVEGIGKRRGK